MYVGPSNINVFHVHQFTAVVLRIFNIEVWSGNL